MALAKRLLLVLSLLLLPGTAFAQSVVVTNIERDDLDPGRDEKSINQANCRENENIDVIVNTANFGEALLEVWVATSSVNCAEDEIRNDPGKGCRKIYSDEPVENTTVSFRVQSLVPANDGGDVCQQASGQATVFFLLVSGTTNITPSATSIAFTFDLSGPRAPTLDEVSPGESSLILDWTGNSSSDRNGYYIYCDDADDSELPDGNGGNATAGVAGATSDAGGTTGGTSGSGGTDSQATAGADATSGSGGTDAANGGGTAGTLGAAADAGNAGTAAVGGSGTAGAGIGGNGSTAEDPSCRAARLKTGEVPPSDLRRGKASQASERGTAKGLVNGKRYACGVASYDDDDNVGVLSNLKCSTPEQVVDYFEAYRAAGGRAGGGYCQFGQGRAQGLALIFGLAGLGFALRRRSRRSAS